jgi:acylphosphatase
MARLRFVVRGRVQGVGFRWFVVEQADHLALRGMVRNCRDGSVEVLAEGSSEGLDALEQALRRGPRLARVDSVEKAQLPHDLKLPNSFEVN